jgi:pimeloyl-ACP methyl ester carboxylesterase
MWEGQLEQADRGWRVIAPHLRGFDGASGDPAATSVDDYAADTIDLLDALHIHEAVIGGLSMGGYIAFAMFRTFRATFKGCPRRHQVAGRHRRGIEAQADTALVEDEVRRLPTK